MWEGARKPEHTEKNTRGHRGRMYKHQAANTRSQDQSRVSGTVRQKLYICATVRLPP